MPETAEFALARAYPHLFSDAEAARLHALMTDPRRHRPRSRVLRAGEPLHTSLYLLSGFTGRFTCDRRGRRQFTALQIPGDYVDLCAFPLKSLEHDVDAMGDAVTRATPHDALADIVAAEPDLARKLWRVSLIDAAIHRTWIFRIGRLPGKARVANFLSEMFARLYARGLATPEGYALPLSQNDLAEVCGMTPVHLNRLLAELRLDRIVTFAAGRVELLDLPRLVRLGEHTREYLYLAPQIEAEIARLADG